MTLLHHSVRRSMFIAGLLALFLLTACAASTSAPHHYSPDFGQSLETGFARQTINPQGPADRSPTAETPGDLIDQIYQKRYIKMMTEEKDDEDDVSSELN